MPDQHTQHIAAAYDKMAPEYDDFSQPFFHNCYTLYEKILLRLVNGRRYNKVLDVGCGTGVQTVELAKFGEQVVGLDISRELLKIAQDKCQHKPNVLLLEADATKIPFPDDYFDAVFSYGDVLSHIPDYKTALAEMARVCRPGGTVTFEADNKWYWGLLHKPAELREAFKSGGGHYRYWNFTYQNGHSNSLKFKTFTRKEIKELLKINGLKPRVFYGLNVFSCLLPDAVLYEHQRSLGGKVAIFLGAVDYRLSSCFPINRMGFNFIVVAQKQGKG
jgi:ubiquinone/menaquinone biosynthesis C-methylase UbiE